MVHVRFAGVVNLGAPADLRFLRSLQSGYLGDKLWDSQEMEWDLVGLDG